MSRGAKSRLQLLAAAALFSTGGTGTKATGFDAWEVVALRAVVAATVILALVPQARRGFSRATAAVAVAYAATAFLFVTANKLTTAAAAIFLGSTSPLYIALLGPWLLGERARRRDLAFMAVLAVGLALVFLGREPPRRTAPDPLTGNALAALCGLTSAVMMLGLRGLGRVQPAAAGSAPAAVALGNLLACGLALPLALPVEGARASDWMVVGWLGLFQIGLAYWLMLQGLRHVPVLEASLVMFVEPVLSPVWAWLLHDETPGVFTLAGGALILGATAARVWTESRQPDGLVPDSEEHAKGGAAMLSLTSSAFRHEGEIPAVHTCQGRDFSPALEWGNLPEGTRSLVLIVDDPDAPDPRAPKMTYVHWVLYNIPPAAGRLPEGVAHDRLPAGTQEGLNDWKRTGYGGPCPPIGRHRYFHKLYALDSVLPDLGTPTKAEVEKAMSGHVLGQATLVGTYEKKGGRG